MRITVKWMCFIFSQWLVKRAIETREELGDQIRAYSVSQFKKHYSLPEDDEHDAKQHKCIQAVNTLKVKTLFI